MLTLECSNCGYADDYDLSEINFDIIESCVNCHNCTIAITIKMETEEVVVEYNKECSAQIVPVLENGRSVSIINEEHPWNGEIALICDSKHKHYRIEIFGKKIWVPSEWVRPINDFT